MLTRLSSICVLEYLSFERRLYIVSQIPEFRKVEKSLPLHLDSLNIEIDKIQIDQCEYYLKRSNLCIDGLSVRQQWFYFYSPLKIPPVDFNQSHYPTEDLWNASPIGLRKRQIQNPPIDTMLAFFPSVYKNLPIQMAFVKLVFDLIGNRPMIYTKKLELLSFIGHLTREEMSEMIFILPLGLKIQAQTIKAKWNELSHGDLDRISNFLGPKPLEEFSTQLWGFENLTHPIVRNSQKLVLHSRGLVVNPQRINHRNIHLKNFVPQNFVNHMNEWIANDPEIGMEFYGHIKTPPEEFWWSMKYDIDEEEFSIKAMMYLNKRESGGRRVKPDERFPNTVYSISMPQTNNPDIEIQMSFIKNESDDSPFHIYLKSQPAGTTTPEQFDSMYWELKLWEIRKTLKLYLEGICLCAACVLFSFFLFFVR
ncbi:unnamed protein product [Caenorhabditis nigoni]